MKPCPRFRPHFRVHIPDPDNLVMVSEDQETRLTGAFFVRIAPFLDGEHTIESIAARLPEDDTVDEVRQAIEILVERGYVTHSPSSDPRVAAYWSSAGLDPARARETLEKVQVGLVVGGEIEREPFETALTQVGLPHGDSFSDATIGLAVVEDYLDPDLAGLNRSALASSAPWLLVMPHGRRTWTGPLLVPGETGCWTCLQQRQLHNRQVEISLLEEPSATPPPRARGALEGSIRAVAHHAALLLAHHALGLDTRAYQGVLHIRDAGNWQTETHVLVRRPRCASCGTPVDDESSARIELQPRPLISGSGTDLRTVTRKETLRRYGHHLSPITGIVNLLQPEASLADTGLHVYRSGVNLARTNDYQTRSKSGFRTMSGGKGTTELQARTGALCEAIERYSGMQDGTEYRIESTYRELGDRAIDPRTCLLYSARQYENRKDFEKASPTQWIGEPFDPDVSMSWSPLWSFSQDRIRYLPTGYLYYRGKRDAARRFLRSNSNGNAAGTSIEDAILQGFFELVERECVGFWWYHRARRPGVDLSSFPDPFLSEFIASYDRLGRDVWALDLTGQFEIPAFVAVSRRRTEEPEAPILGFGAHCDPQIALNRSLTEMSQMLVMGEQILKIPDPGRGDPRHPEIDWLIEATVEQHPHLLPDPQASARTFSSYAPAWEGDGMELVGRCQQRVEERALEFCVLDQTRSDIGLPVAKVIVPGMRHFWPRFAPGRLYDVPLELGWLDAPATEEGLNPIPIFW